VARVAAEYRELYGEHNYDEAGNYIGPAFETEGVAQRAARDHRKPVRTGRDRRDRGRRRPRSRAAADAPRRRGSRARGRRRVDGGRREWWPKLRVTIRQRVRQRVIATPRK